MSSTKITSDKNSVYLHIEDLADCCFELWQVEDSKSSSVKVKIPSKTWKSIIKDWKRTNKSKK